MLNILSERAYKGILRLYRLRFLVLNKSMPSSIHVNLLTSTSRDVFFGGDLSLSNVPSSSRLYQMIKPVLSQNNILHLSPSLLKNTNKCPLNGSLSMKLSVNIESLLKLQRMSAGWVYINIFTDDGSVSIIPACAKPKVRHLMFYCLPRNEFAKCCRKKAQAPGEHDRCWVSLPL